MTNTIFKTPPNPSVLNNNKMTGRNKITTKVPHFAHNYPH